MAKRLAIIVLGKQNSGKSSTWYEIFGKTVRRGWKTLILDKDYIPVYLRNSSYEETGQEIELDVFFRNSSFEEYGDDIEDDPQFKGLPHFVFCSVQYTEKGVRTINWFKKNGYYLYIQWLNPGYCLSKEYEDFLGFEKQFAPYGTFTKNSGKETPIRTAAIAKFLTYFLKNRPH